jgi:hypothetical protein
VFVLFAYGYAFIVKRESYLRLHDTWKEFHRPDPVLAYTISPNQKDFPFYLEEEDIYVPASTNAQGFRNDGDVSGAPVAGLGDSIIFGMYATNDQLWSAVLSQELGVPVANYGVMGYSLWQYNLVADRYLREADHQVVFYGVFANDLRSGPQSARDIRKLQWIQMRRWRSPINLAIYDLLDESPAYQIVEALRKSLRRVANTAAEPVELPYGLDSHCVPWAIGYSPASIPDRLDRAIELSEEIGYELLFVLIPTKETVYSEELMPVCDQRAQQATRRERAGYEQICDYVEKRGYHCYDMTEDVRAAADEADELLYFRVDGHLNPRGHQVVAQLLDEYIRQHDLLPGVTNEGARGPASVSEG